MSDQTPRPERDHAVDTLLQRWADDAASAHEASAADFAAQITTRVASAKPRRVWQRRRVVSFAAAAAVLLVATVALLVRPQGEMPAPRLLASVGNVTLDPASPRLLALATGEDSVAHWIQLDGKIRGFAGPDTRVEVLAQHRVLVQSGVAWFQVDRSRETVDVSTRHGTVRVLGTVFGVEVREKDSVVHVAEGLVKLDLDYCETDDPVRAGESVVMDPRLSDVVRLDAAAPAPPDWIARLIEAAEGAP